MGRILFYIAFPFLLLISILPFPLLYLLSDFFYFIVYHVAGYRKKVVRENMKNAFPEWTDQKRLQVEKEFYKWLCDVLLEILKGLTISKKSAMKRAKMINPELVNQCYEEGKSAIWVTPHMGNWEWSIFSSDLYTKYKMNVVYHKIKNPGFEWMVKKIRTRFGSVVITMEQTLRHLIKHKNEQYITALVCDQTPSPDGAYWTTFLNQETPFITGPEKISKMLDHVIIYLDINRVKRGYYELTTKILEKDPKATAEWEITEKIVRRIEKDIEESPAYWLWSHRRWKHKRPVQE